MFDEQHSHIDPNKSVYQVIWVVRNSFVWVDADINARAYRSRFNFSGGDQVKLRGVLSGGERNASAPCYGSERRGQNAYQ